MIFFVALQDLGFCVSHQLCSVFVLSAVVGCVGQIYVHYVILLYYVEIATPNH